MKVEVHTAEERLRIGRWHTTHLARKAKRKAAKKARRITRLNLK